MSFRDRAVRLLLTEMRQGRVARLSVSSVLSCNDVDPEPFVPLMNDRDAGVRVSASGLLCKFGRADAVVERALVEQDIWALREMLWQLGQPGTQVDNLVCMLHHESSIISEAAVLMFRRANREDLLLPLLFDENESVVARTKRYLHEHDEKDRAEAGAVGQH